MKFHFLHENFNVLDLEKSIKFYDKALGLKVVREKFAEDGNAQLDWVYKNSEYYEGSVGLYPIYRIL